MPSIAIANHPERNVIRAQLAQNIVLKEMVDGEREELEPHLLVVDCAKGESLLDQGVHEMEQYFVLDGVLKRVVTNANAKEMILRFADEHDIETSYAAWRLNTPTPYSIVCLTKARVAKLPMPTWVAFMDRQFVEEVLLHVDDDQARSFAFDQTSGGLCHGSSPPSAWRRAVV